MPTWGQSSITGITATASVSSVFRMMGGTSPNVDDMVLQSLSFDFAGGASNRTVRCAIYQGGSSSSPIDATLLEDLGTFTVTASEPRKFWTVASTTNPTIAKNTATWLAVKAGAGSFTWYFSSSSAQAGDFFTGDGRAGITGATNGTDPTLGFPATLDGSNSYAATWYAWYLDYNVGGSASNTPRSQFYHIQGMR